MHDKELLYIAFKDFSKLHFGANAKVISQCKVFEKNGFNVHLIGRFNNISARIHLDGSCDMFNEVKTPEKNGRIYNLLAKMNQYKAVESYVHDKQFDVCYIRYDFSDRGFIHLLKIIKLHCKKIILELPTYPYENENSLGFLNKIKMLIDMHYRKKLKDYISQIVTFYGGYDTLFGIPVKVIHNGFDFSKMDLVQSELPENEIHIIAVSSMREWHGYERMIEGMRLYYSNKAAKEKVFLHLVGNGKCYKQYSDLATKYHLNDYIIMEGALYGKDLDRLYEKCAIGIDSLARHRSNIEVLSSLKSREYGAKGIPMINSCKIDIIKDDFPYLLMVPSDESPVNIEDVLKFYHKCYDNCSRFELGQRVRSYIQSKSDMSLSLKPLINELI